VVALVIAFALIPAALAAKGGKPGGGNSTGASGITGPVMVYDANGTGLPDHGDVVKFNVSTTATTAPFVNLQCFQNGVEVLNSWNAYYAGTLDPMGWDFGLASGVWQSGAANCTAWLVMYSRNGSWT